MDKSQIIAAVVARLQSELAPLEAAAADTYENATSDETRSEGKYDTRALESSYLAEGQARQVAALREAIAAFQAMECRSFGPGVPIAMSALIELEQRGVRDLYLLGPRSGGTEVHVDSRDIMVLTPQSPIGARLLGATMGSVIRLDGSREARVVDVR